jgi:hypothetical protein
VSFLAPFWLVLGAAAAVPLVLHLMRRHIDKRLDFPAVRYLVRAERENVRQLRMRNLVLMLLRTLAILFVALAAARPIAGLFGAGHAPTAVAIVLDNSMSTGVIVDGAPLLRRLERAARDVVDGAASTDRLWLVTADGRVTGGSRAALRDAIDRTEVYGGSGDLPAAVTRAAGLTRASGMTARAVVTVTDGQATAWGEPISLADLHAVLYAPAMAPPPNRSVALAEARPVRWTPRGAVLVRAEGADSVTYRVTLGGRTLARGLLRGDEEATIRAEPPERGWVAGKVELSPDELRADDERWFAVWVGPAPRVQALSGAGPFAQSALEALVQSDRATAGTEIVVAPADLADRLPALLIAPADPVRLGAANRVLERLGVPWRFQPPRHDQTVAHGEGLDGTSVSLRYPLRAEPGATGDTLATAAGDAWIVAGNRYVIVGSPLDPQATNLPIRAQFVPWLSDMLALRLAPDASALIAATPGQAIRLPAGTDGYEDENGDLVTAESVTHAPGHPGVWFLRRGATRVGALVVNAAPPESRLARLPAADLANQIDSKHFVATSDQGRLARLAFAAGSRRPLQPILLLLALLCLIGEMVVVRRTERPLRHAVA